MTQEGAAQLHCRLRPLRLHREAIVQRPGRLHGALLAPGNGCVDGVVGGGWLVDWLMDSLVSWWVG
jgi:hypothetical protein